MLRSLREPGVGYGKTPKVAALLDVYFPDSSLWLLVASVTISGLSVVVLEYSGDPGEPDRQSVAFGRGESVEQLGVLGAQLFPDLPGSGLPVVCELESAEASIVWVPLS